MSAALPSEVDAAEDLATWRHAAVDIHAADELLARVTDAVLCAIAAQHVGSEPAARIRSYVEATASPGPATDWTTGSRLDTASAALLNGVAVRALDLNDTHVAAGIVHPSDAIAAVVAIGETARSSHAKTLNAVGVTYETICRLNEVADLRSRGWEAATLTGLGVVVGGSLLWGLDDLATAQALRIVAMTTPALRCTRTGALSDWKAISSPRTAVEGIRALEMVRHGISGPQAAFTDGDGFERRVTGPLRFAKDGNSRISSVMLKLEPAQVFVQDVLRATRLLLHDEGTRAEKIESIHVGTFERCAATVGGPLPLRPDGALDPVSSDHSLQVCLAVGLVTGKLGPSAFDQASFDPQVRRLAEAIAVSVDPRAEAAFPEELRSVVEVRLIDGSELRRSTSTLPPVATSDLGSKFDSLLGAWPQEWPWDLHEKSLFPAPAPAARGAKSTGGGT